MKDCPTDDIIDLYHEKKWREISEKYHDHPDRNKVLWVFPTEDNFEFLKRCLQFLKCDRVLSIGCGSGLLEWMITEATGVPVSGVEINGVWWQCKFAPKTFIPLIITTSPLDQNMTTTLQNSNSTALLFCYFNNRPAFQDYLKYFSGSVLIIIGPGDGKGVHTDPKPFADVSDGWTLYDWQEVRHSRDFIVVYYKNNIEHSNKFIN